MRWFAGRYAGSSGDRVPSWLLAPWLCHPRPCPSKPGCAHINNNAQQAAPSPLHDLPSLGVEEQARRQAWHVPLCTSAGLGTTHVLLLASFWARHVIPWLLSGSMLSVEVMLQLLKLQLMTIYAWALASLVSRLTQLLLGLISVAGAARLRGGVGGAARLPKPGNCKQTGAAVCTCETCRLPATASEGI